MNKPSCFTQQQYNNWLDTKGVKLKGAPCDDCQSHWQNKMIQQRKCDNPGYTCNDVFEEAGITRADFIRKVRSDYERKPKKKPSGETKICKKCGPQPIESFSKYKKNGRYYYMGTCKVCIAKRERIRYREQRRMAMS